MPDPRWLRAGREIAAAAVGVSFETFDGWALDRLAALFDPHTVGANRALWSRGQPVEFLYFIREGRVQARRPGVAPWTFEGRWFLGGFEGHADRPAQRDLVALTDLDALRIRRQDWLELLEDSFEITRSTVTACATAVAKLDERIPTVERVPSGASAPRTSEHPLTMIEKIAFLGEVPIARGPGVQSLADLSSVSAEITLLRGEGLFAQGATHDHHFLVVEGEVEATRQDPEVRRSYGPGDLVTGAAAIADRASDWTARAGTAARLLTIPRETWFDLMEEHFELVDATLAMLAMEREALLGILAVSAGPGGLLLT